MNCFVDWISVNFVTLNIRHDAESWISEQKRCFPNFLESESFHNQQIKWRFGNTELLTQKTRILPPKKSISVSVRMNRPDTKFFNK